MKKILVVVMTLLCLGGTSAFAADSKFPNSLAAGDFVASVGVGSTSLVLGKEGGGMVVPPLSLSVEYALPIVIPLSVGATIGVATSTQSGGSRGGGVDGGDTRFTHDRSVFSIGAKAAYHFDWKIRGLDTYAALTLGANVMSVETEYNKNYFTDPNTAPSAGDDPGFLFGLEIGARFFFNENFGVFMEEGFNTFTYLRSGLVYKFKF
jgi:hypothetical protein